MDLRSRKDHTNEGAGHHPHPATGSSSDQPAHTAVNMLDSSATMRGNLGAQPPAGGMSADVVSFVESDGQHTQHFHIAGNRLMHNAKELSANGGSFEKQGPSLWERAYLTLMPEGYPNSVSSDYTVHQIWDAFNFASYNIMATLATRAMLKGVGVGSSQSTVLSGTLSWLLKDVSALLSSIGFAVQLANDLDNDAKQWRMFADITTDIGLLLEVYSEHLPPSLFTVVICLASMFRSVWTVAGWSSRVALTQHFAIRNNTADVSARNGAQETLFTMVGMLGGMYMAYLLAESSPFVQAIYFFVGTISHLYFNYKSVKSLVLTNFNKHRALICINRYLSTGIMCNTAEANDLEPVMWWREPFQTTFGVRPSELKKVVPGPVLSDAIKHAMSAPEGKRFAVIATTKKKGARVRFDVLLRDGAGDTESLWAFFCAAKAFHSHRTPVGSHLIVANDTDGYNEFKEAAIAAGWEMDKLQFRVFDWRIGDA